MGGRVPWAASPAVPTTDSFEKNTVAADEEFVVGVVDTGLIRHDKRVHHWLEGHVNDHDDNEDVLAGGSQLGVNDGHGTFVSGLILREAPGVTIRMIRAVDEQDPPDDVDAKVAAAFTALLTDPHVKVINLSFGGLPFENKPQQGILDALATASKNGVVVTAPAGNHPDGIKVWPAAFAEDFENVVSVGAVDETPTYLTGGPPPKASFSNYGSWVKAYAGGVDVLGPFVTLTQNGATADGWARWSGTSFASAKVAGIIAARALNGGSALEAAHRLLAEQRRSPDDRRGWPAPVAYIQGVSTTWSLKPPNNVQATRQ